MTAPLAPIGAIAPLTTVPGVASISGDGGGGDGFAAMLGNSLENLQALQTKTDDMAIKAATGDLTDVHDYMIASAQSGVAAQMTVAVRNKAVEAFTEIMRMQA